MTITSYKVKFVSQTNSIVVLFSSLAAVFIGISTIPYNPVSKYVATFIVIILFFIVWLLWQKFVTGRTEWTLEENEIKIMWTKKFALARTKDFNIQWSEIQNISRGFEPHYYNLRIKLNSGATVRFYHDILTTRDDFEKLIIALNQKISKKKN